MVSKQNKKFKIKFVDVISAKDEEDAITKLYDYLQACVMFQDFDAFEIKEYSRKCKAKLCSTYAPLSSTFESREGRL